MAITLTKAAAKAIAVTMENAELDTEIFGLELGVDEQNNMTITFTNMKKDVYKKFHDEYGLKIRADSQFDNMMVDFGKYGDRKGLFILDKEKYGNNNN
jgi:hypothetical protein